MLASTEWFVCLMATWGFYAKTIARTVRKYDGSSFEVGSIYRVLKKNGIKLREYRDGTSQEAKDIITRMLKKRVPRKVKD